MNETPKIGRVPYVGVWTAVAGAAAGSLEAALVARFDPEVTVGLAGGFTLWAANAGLIAAGALAFGALVELASRLAARALAKDAGALSVRSVIGIGTRVIPGVRKRNKRAKTAATAVAFSLVLYGAYLGNLYLLPGKLHPISILADVVILLAAYGILRLGSLLAPGAVFVWSAAVLVFVTSAGITLTAGARPTGDGGEDVPGYNALGPKERYNNVLLITLDTTRADRLGCYGRNPTITPNLDRLARRGTLYERAYCAMPLTGPSHTAVLSGLWAREAGVIQNGRPVPAAVVTLPEIFNDAGFRTGAVVGAFPVSSKLGFNRGFEDFDDHFSPLNALTRITVVRLAGDLGLLQTKARLQRRADEVTDRALAWLARRDARPFFLWVHYFDPHTPYDPPAEYMDDNNPAVPEIRAYDGEVKYMDTSVGRLLGYLEETGLAASTVIIATADHGESLGEHEYYWDHGRDVYEPSTRVPYIVAGPGVQPGFVEKRPVSNSAVFEAALALAAGAPLPAPPERPLFGEALEDGEYRTMWLSGDLQKFISNHGAGPDEFYDLTRDPLELENLVSVEAESGLYAEALGSFERSLPPIREIGPMDKETASKLKDLGYINR